MALPKDEPSIPTIYFVQGALTRAIKIGWSTEPLQRIRCLQGASPDRLHVLGLERGAKDDERRLHRAFQYLHMWGEWFYVEAELVEYIADHALSVPSYYATHAGDVSARFLERWDDLVPGIALSGRTLRSGRQNAGVLRVYTSVKAMNTRAE